MGSVALAVIKASPLPVLVVKADILTDCTKEDMDKMTRAERRCEATSSQTTQRPGNAGTRRTAQGLRAVEKLGERKLYHLRNKCLLVALSLFGRDARLL